MSLKVNAAAPLGVNAAKEFAVVRQKARKKVVEVLTTLKESKLIDKVEEEGELQFTSSAEDGRAYFRTTINFVKPKATTEKKLKKTLTALSFKDLGYEFRFDDEYITISVNSDKLRCSVEFPLSFAEDLVPDVPMTRRAMGRKYVTQDFAKKISNIYLSLMEKYPITLKTKVSASMHKKISSIVSSVVSKELDPVTMVANAISDTIDTALDSPETVDPAKAARYIERGIEEVNKIVSDINFELEETVNTSAAKVSKIFLPEDNSAIITLEQALTVENVDYVSKLAPTAKKFSLRPEFSKYVSVQITPPMGMSQQATLFVKVTIPADVVSDMVGGAPSENWNKAVKVVEAYAKSLAKQLD